MNDNDLTELILRANAYLDGELGADEMAQAEADPAVMAEVEQLRGLQAELRAVEPPADSAREAAIGAALDEFDRRLADRQVAAASSPAVVPLRRRPSYARWLTAAAAVVAIGVLGVVVAQSGGDDDDAAGSAAEVTADAATERSADTGGAATELDDATPTMAAADVGGRSDGEGTAEEADTTAPAALGETPDQVGDVAPDGPTPAETQAPSVLSAPDTLEPTVIPTTAPRTFDEPVTSANLYEIGQLLLADYRAGTLPVPDTHCDFGGFVVLARAPFIVSDTTREAVIAADPGNRDTGAFDADTCEPFEIVTAPAP